MYATAYTPESIVATPQEATINVAIADDYPLLLAGMRQILAPCDDIVVVAECTRMPDLLAQVALKRPEIILFGCETNRDCIAFLNVIPT
jgi:DNA-binding NarL/FixJ family response regulator